jgi:uncharacterized membrane protein
MPPLDQLTPFLLDWLNLLLRWGHVAVGIGWIGTSFYFIALDLALRKRPAPEGVLGTAWEVHGGGFYRVDKYAVAPPELPPDLIWFRWEAYLTWITGFALLILQYYLQADVYLVQPSVLDLKPGQAIIISLATLAVGLFAYDRLCKSDLRLHPPSLAGAVFVLILMAALTFGRTFSGRGALIHVGALIGTMMAYNVFAVIIPNQKKIVAALIAGQPPDPELGAVAKVRSVHNNYLTLPVLVLMVSNHYPQLTQSSGYTWLVVGLIVIVGAAVRHFLNRHDAGDPLAKIAWTLPVAAMALLGAIYLSAPRTTVAVTGEAVTEGEALAIVAKHCVMCHSERPTHEGISSPPKDVVLTSVDAIRLHGAQILEQTVFGDSMPLGNETGMIAEERQRLGAFLQQK